MRPKRGAHGDYTYGDGGQYSLENHQNKRNYSAIAKGNPGSDWANGLGEFRPDLDIDEYGNSMAGDPLALKMHYSSTSAQIG